MIIMAMVRIGVLIEPLLAVENEEIHPKGIEGRHKHAGQYGKVGEARCR